MKLRRVADTQNLRRLEAEIRSIVKEMKKAISDKDFEKAVFLREREIELKEEIERFKQEREIVGEEMMEVTQQRRRGDHQLLDRHPGDVDRGRRSGEADQHGRHPDAAHRRPGQRHHAPSPAPSAAPASAWPRRTGRWARSSSSARRASERPRWRAGWPSSSSASQKHLIRFDMSRVHGEARRLEAHRLAPGLRRPRRRRPAHRARAPQSVLAWSCSTRSRRRIPTSPTSSCRSWRTASSPTPSATRSTSATR